MLDPITTQAYLNSAGIIVGVVVGLIGIYKGVKKWFNKGVEDRLENKQRMDDVERKVCHIKDEISLLKQQVDTISATVTEGSIKYSEIAATVSMLHDVSKDLDSDIKEIMKILLERR